MQTKQSIDSSECVGSIVSLANLTTGAIWAPMSFELDRSTGVTAAIRKVRAEEPAPDGVGANVITLSQGGLSRRTLAIYQADEDEWMLFDGKREYHLENVVVTWTKGIQIIPGVFSLATLALNCAGVVVAQ
ncbi:hypothetical protein [Massilia sp. TSP1-1-2]|uniref:hypothetical protein n=1 Tax=unclassified Massilia TaxID=2609279 RepID=UPI003CE799D8